MIFLLKYWKYIALVLAVLSLLWACVAIRAAIVKEGYDKCLADQESAEKQSVETKNEIKTKNHRSSVSDIDRRLIAHWLRSE